VILAHDTSNVRADVVEYVVRLVHSIRNLLVGLCDGAQKSETEMDNTRGVNVGHESRRHDAEPMLMA
jgi:hypothetical protein